MRVHIIKMLDEEMDGDHQALDRKALDIWEISSDIRSPRFYQYFKDNKVYVLVSDSYIPANQRAEIAEMLLTNQKGVGLEEDPEHLAKLLIDSGYILEDGPYMDTAEYTKYSDHDFGHLIPEVSKHMFDDSIKVITVWGSLPDSNLTIHHFVRGGNDIALAITDKFGVIELFRLFENN
jgi:hypothetical protein